MAYVRPHEKKIAHGLTGKEITACNVQIEHPSWGVEKIAEYCKEQGLMDVSRQSIYRYLAKPEAQEYMKKQYDIIWDKAGPEAQEMMVALMRRGNLKATEFILRCWGRNPEQKVAVELEDGINITIKADKDNED